jgi:hypothetical protein
MYCQQAIPSKQHDTSAGGSMVVPAHGPWYVNQWIDCYFNHHATVNASGSYANTATLSSEADPTPGNNSATVTPVPVPQANVGITQNVNNATLM